MSAIRRSSAGNFNRNIRKHRLSRKITGRFAEHRAVWAPGVKKRLQAILYINKRIEEHAGAVNAARVLSLGCKTGSSLIDLAKSRDARYSGLTLSRFQKQTGDDLILRQGLQDKIRIFEGDFRDPKVFRLFPNQDLIYAVESFSAIAATTNIAPLIAENIVAGGRVIICDHMLAEREDDLGDKDAELLAVLRKYGCSPGIRSARQWIESFENAGLETIAAEDFSSWLRVSPVSPAMINAASWIAGRTGWNKTEVLAGNAALSSLLRRGSMHYRFLVFQKNREPA